MASFPRPANLFDELDKKVMIYLRDGRTLIGYLRSVDQFANLVLHRTIERIHVGRQYGDIERGVIIVRGENVVLVGEVDDMRQALANLEEVSFTQILERQRMEQEKDHQQEILRSQFMKDRGLQIAPEIGQDDMY